MNGVSAMSTWAGGHLKVTGHILDAVWVVNTGAFAHCNLVSMLHPNEFAGDANLNTLLDLVCPTCMDDLKLVLLND